MGYLTWYTVAAARCTAHACMWLVVVVILCGTEDVVAASEHIDATFSTPN